MCNKYESASKILTFACNSLPSLYNKYESACDEHRSVCKTEEYHERSNIIRL